MSLQVWLPLAGNLDNFGLSNITVTNNGATVDNSGKIGKCYKCSGDSRISFPSFSWMTMKPQNNFSFFCWVKGTTTGWLFACSAWELRLAPTYIQIHLAGNGQYPARYNGTFDTNTWYHLGFTWSGVNGKLLLYLNGSKVAESNVPSSANFDIASTFNLPYDGPRYLNDIRIYNHTLSAKEVKEISKALVLHYPLNNPYNDTLMPNLLSTSQQRGTKTISLKANTVHYGLTACPSTSVVAGKPYLWYVEIRCTQNADKLKSIGIDTNASGGSYSGNDSAHTVNQVSNSSLAAVKTGDWCKFYCLTTMKSDATNGTIFHSIYGQTDSDTSVTFEWRNMMLVNSSQLISFRGASDTKVIDCGIANIYDGAINGKIAVIKDSPRYSNSYQFTTGSDYIKSNFTAIMNELSISFWVKPSSSNGGYSIICSNYNNPSGGLWIATNCEGCSVWAYKGAYMKVSGSLANDTWHHCVYTFKDGVSKWYINGEEKTLTTNTYTGTTLPITDLTIGNSYTGTSWNTKRYGNLSDFRLYATALSTEDIAELYHSAVIVDNTGKNYAYEYFEA